MNDTSATPAARAPGRRPQRRQVRNYLLDAGLQLRFAAYLVLTAGMISAVMGWWLWLSYREAGRLVAAHGSGAVEAVALLMAREDRARLVWLALGLTLVLICLLAFALAVTHRVVGPAMVLARSCRDVGEGSLQRLRPLRRGDLLVKLADDMEAMVDALRVRENREREALCEVAAALDGGPDGVARAREIVKGLAAEKAARLDT